MNPELIGKEKSEDEKERKTQFLPSLPTVTTESTSRMHITTRPQKGPKTRRMYITDASLLPNVSMQGRLFDAPNHFPMDCDYITVDSEGVEKRNNQNVVCICGLVENTDIKYICIVWHAN